jgi:hypothetical protein
MSKVWVTICGKWKIKKKKSEISKFPILRYKGSFEELYTHKMIPIAAL